ncbi:uncharacterized protein LOC128439945 [Pleuronectes platessa]|uniref:uncharacterized protein LOC128439945 n=1 Tax=Pleuronectes platessa TaxID=8262 RepID=UPI00232A3680|nr:uncharacterized protein LOC128439945 [Pleuronectes platessa]XP_053278458.1 uncharacterized protein LOC128439945 [Pleuronectes platessa]
MSLRGSDQQEAITTLHLLLRTEKQRRERRRMDEIKRIKISLHLLLVLIPFTALAEQYSTIIIRAGAEVTLPCPNVRDDYVNCGATDWFFVDSERTRSARLFVKGQLIASVISKSKADRLRLAANCALVIREVRAEDAGDYICRQFDQTNEQSWFFFSVVNVTEQERTDEVMLTCSVSTCRGGLLTVKWLFMNMDVDENNKELRTSQSRHSATVSFSKSHSVYKIKNYGSLTCKVKDGYTEETFAFILPSSDWWWYIYLVVGCATLVTLVGILIKWRRNKIQARDDAVAYSTGEGPSSSTGHSADPSNLNANVTIIQ